MKTTIAILGLLLLILFECARVYLIMPMPGSQNFDSIEIAYFLGSNKWIIRFIGYLMVSVPLFLILRNGVKKEKLIVGGLTAMYLIVFYVFTFKMEADKMFYQPIKVVTTSLSKNKMKKVFIPQIKINMFMKVISKFLGFLN